MDQQPPRSRLRRFAGALLFAACAALTGCEPVKQLDVRVVTDEEAPLRFAVLPVDELVGLKRRFLPFAEYVGKGLGRPVEMIVSPDYDSLGALVEQGKADIGFFSGISYERAKVRHRLTGIARTLHGKRTTYRGVILVRKEDAIRSVADLRGKRFAYVDRDSGSGFVAANKTLLAAGLSPLTDLASVTFTFNHFSSMQGVIDGRFDAAAVFENAHESYKDRLDVGRLRVLASTEPVPKDVVATSESAPASFRRRVWEQLGAMPSTPEGREVLRVLERSNPIDGFAPMELTPK